MIAPDPIAIANDRGADVYRRLEARSHGADKAYLLLEEAVTMLEADAMLAIGAVDVDGELDPKAQELFGDDKRVYAQIAQEIAEHVYTATRAYLTQRSA